MAEGEGVDSEISLGVRISAEFTVDGKLVTAEVEDSAIKWKGEGRKTGTSVLWEDVIAVYKGEACRGPGVKKTGGGGEEDRFTLHYMEHYKLNQLRHKHVTFVSSSKGVQEWVNIVSGNTGNDRPQRLLTIVNPIGGQQKGHQLYGKVVGPLFALAGIETELIVTERFRHAEEIAKTYDFSKVDGLIVSGGDGLMHEVLQNLIPRYNEGVNLNDPEVELKPIPFTIGALPTGTGNGISMACHGCVDLETGVLVAIKGKKRYLNIASVHEEKGHLLGYSCTTLGYGFWADLLMKTDDSRWLKTLRYPVTMVSKLTSKKRQITVEGEYMPARRPDGDERPQENEDEWLKFSGSYTGIYCMIGGFNKIAGKTKLQCKPDEAGFNLLLEKDTGRFHYFKWLTAFRNMPRDAYDADHIEEHYVKAYRFHVVDSGPPQTNKERRNDELEHQISFEGEFRRTDSKSMDVRIQRKVVQFYSTKFEDW